LRTNRITPNSKKIIKEWFVEHFDLSIFKAFLSKNTLLEKEERATRNVFGIKKENLEIYDNIEINFKIFSIGNKVGRIRKGEFFVSIRGMELANEIKEVNKVILNENGEKRFLYGKDLHFEDMENFVGNWTVGKATILINKHQDFLGWGIIIWNRFAKPRGEFKKLIKHKQDVGWFLRSGI